MLAHHPPPYPKLSIRSLFVRRNGLKFRAPGQTCRSSTRPKHETRTCGAQDKAINPDAYIVGEIWHDSRPWLQGDQFDAVMNYNFAFACDEFFFRERTRITASRFNALLRELREAYPACVAPVMQNLFGSHDTARLASHAFNRDRLDYRAFDETYHPRDSRAPQLDTRRPDEHARALQRLTHAQDQVRAWFPQAAP